MGISLAVAPTINLVAPGPGCKRTGRAGPRSEPVGVTPIMRLGDMDTMQEAIRRAIGDELFLMTERRAGWKVLLQRGNRYREANWPQF
jgi:hypothetical protein